MRNFGLIDDFLKDKNLTFSPDHAGREQGNLNKVYFLQDAGGARYVLRVHRQDNRADIESYISRQIRCLGAESYGARLGYRNMDAQASFMRRLLSKDIFVPRVTDCGPDWMLMEFVRGRSLKDILPGLRGEAAARLMQDVLLPFMVVHEKGECLWDRWGGNELIDSGGRVCFIDFDIAIDWPAQVPVRIRAGFDLAFMLRGCIQFCPDKDLAAETLSALLGMRKDFTRIYDVRALLNFLGGQIDFYTAEYCRNPRSSAEEKEKHLLINRGIRKIMEDIEKPL